MKSLFQVLLVGLCFVYQIHSASISGNQDQAFVLSIFDNGEALLERHGRSVKETSISRMHVTSVVMSRFARVTVVSEMENHLNESKDLTFSVRLPDAAFITEFQMEVGGVTFIGKIKEKEAAKEQFNQAVEKGNTAGLVTADVRETQTFNVQANVAAESSVTFTLVYQELLKRRLGKYNHVILVNPGQTVNDLVIDVYITEKPAITSLKVSLPNSENKGRGKSGEYGEIPLDYDIRRSKHQAKITFKPTENQQKQLMLIPEDERKLTVRYDVTREELGGEILTRNGYFVHFFAPENLPIFPKNVVFVIDRSGSMWGTKMKQTKKAFTSVLKEMRESDKFSIISFAGEVTVWNSSQNLVKVDKESVQSAIDYVNGIVATGATNINSAMIKATELLAKEQSDEQKSSMIILLTDGDPTAGVTNTARIRMNVKNAVDGRFSVFCLGFGEYVDHEFLKRMANENDGIPRQIYEDSDADLQLEGFFQEVATPLLLHFEIKYRGSEVQNVTKSKFDKYFSGSEVVVVGQVTSNEKGLKTVVKGESMEGKVTFRTKNTPQDDSFQHWFKDTGDFDGFIERLWAYYTIKELLEEKDVSDSSKEKNELNGKILHLAMKYSFVTPLTSMVVTLPEDDITTASPNGTTIHPPLPPCFLRGSKLPHYLTYPPIWCPYVMSEEEVEAQKESQSIYGQSSFFNAPPPQYFMSYYPLSRPLPARSGGSVPRNSYVPTTTAPSPRTRSAAVQKRRRNKTGSKSRGFSSVASTTRASRRKPARTTTTTTPSTTLYTTTIPSTTTTISTTHVMPTACNKNLTQSSGKIQSIGNVNFTITCEWVITLDEGSWINMKIEKLDTILNKINIFDGATPVFSHSFGTSSEKYYLLKNNTARIQMEVYTQDNDRPPMVVSYEEYIPGGLKPQTTELSSENLFSEDLAISSTIITSSVNKTGFISSPNYPESYPSNSHSLWTFVNTDPNLQLRLRFLDMNIEMNGDGSCTHDRIVVLDGDDEIVLCGYDLSDGSLSTTAQSVKIAFVSDDKLETSGFKMKYEFS